MKASVIVPTYNRSDQLRRTLKSLAEQNFAFDEFEILVIDNGSTDDTREVVETFKEKNPRHHISYIYDDIPGLLTGRHRGAKEAKSEILVFIDDDIQADKNWLTAIVETFERRSDAHLVGGKCLPDYEADPPAWLNYFWQFLPGGEKMLVNLSLCDFGDEEREVDSTWVWGLNFSIRRKTLFELGGFHPDSIPPQFQHFQGDGETGLSFKIAQKGYKTIYQPKALVHHDVPGSRMTPSYFDKRSFYQGVCNSYTEIRKNKGVNVSKIKSIFAKTIRPATGKFIRFFTDKEKSRTNDLSREQENEKQMLFERFRKMEMKGYRFHQEAAKNSPIVLKWILKEDYFDYKLPEI